MIVKRVASLAQAAFAASAALMSAALAEDLGAAHVRVPAPPLRHVVLTGKVKSVGVSRQERGATLQSSFYLDTDDSNAATSSVLVVIPARRFFCAEGERATLEGDLSPADDPFPPMLLSPKLLSCGGMEGPQ